MKFLHTADILLDCPLVGLERYEGGPLEAVQMTMIRWNFEECGNNISHAVPRLGPTSLASRSHLVLVGPKG